NSMLCANAAAIGELLRVMRCAGVDRTLAVDTLVASLGRVASKRDQLIENDMRPRFSANALLKDLRLARGSRERLNVEAPLLESALAEFERAVATGIGDDDYIAAAPALETAPNFSGLRTT